METEPESSLTYMPWLTRPAWPALAAATNSDQAGRSAAVPACSCQIVAPDETHPRRISLPLPMHATRLWTSAVTYMLCKMFNLASFWVRDTDGQTAAALPAAMSNGHGAFMRLSAPFMRANPQCGTARGALMDASRSKCPGHYHMALHKEAARA